MMNKNEKEQMRNMYLKHVSKWMTSGMEKSKYCQKNNLDLKKFYYFASGPGSKSRHAIAMGTNTATKKPMLSSPKVMKSLEGFVRVPVPNEERYEVKLGKARIFVPKTEIGQFMQEHETFLRDTND